MGLAISVGLLADLIENDEEGAEWLRESLARVNEVLMEQNLPTHTEPETVPRLDDRAGLQSFPYSFLHYLRRVYAHWLQNPDQPATPCPEGERPAEDPLLDDESTMFSSHLLCHSDCEGYYLPIDFDEVIFDLSDQDRLPGGMLGSTYRLHEELIAMAPCLGIRDADQLSDATAEEINAQMDEESGLWIERTVWLTLYEACRLSKEHNTAICFG